MGIVWSAMLASAPALAEGEDVAPASEESPLLEHGVTLRAGYTGEFAANPTGGIAQGARYAGQAAGGVDLDMDRLADVAGGTLHATVTSRHGRSLSADAIGNGISVQEIFGGGETTRLTELNWEQSLLGGSLTLQGGRTFAGSYFATSSNYCAFQSNAICGNPTLPFIDGNMTSWPVATWGGRVRIAAGDRLSFQTGAYDVDPTQGEGRQHGVDWGTGHATGVFIPWELGYQTSYANDSMPRSYKLGGFYDTSSYADPLRDAAGAPAALTGRPHAVLSGRTAVYALFDQVVWKPEAAAQRGLTVFGGLALGLNQRQDEDYFIHLGLVQTGTFEGREKDTIGFLVTEQRFSSAVIDNIRLSRQVAGGSGAPSPHEIIMELNYGIQVGPGIRLMPNLQFIIDPDLLIKPSYPANIPNAFVVGLKLDIDLPDLIGLARRRQ